jgi:hypothetical protein
MYLPPKKKLTIAGELLIYQSIKCFPTVGLPTSGCKGQTEYVISANNGTPSAYFICLYYIIDMPYMQIFFENSQIS